MKLVVLAAVVATGWFLLGKKPSKQTAVVQTKPTITPPIPQLKKTTDTIVYGEQLTPEEQASLESKSNDLLAVEGLVTLHKAYASAIASKLAAAGDTRAEPINYRIANWSAPQMQIPTDAVSVVESPLNYTFQQIFEMAASGESNAVKAWAAELLQENGQAEQASILRGQIAASQVQS